LRLVQRVNSTIDSIGFVLSSVRLSRPADAEAGERQRFLEAFAQ